jgi:hypothetical protein
MKPIKTPAQDAKGPIPASHDLERFIHSALASLPDRRAPLSLEARVLAEIARRAALPWWRRSYAHWPVAARGAFLVGSASAAALLIAGLMSLARNAGATQAAGEVASRFAWLGLVRETAATLAGGGGSVFGAIPSLWIYGALAVFAACYATLIGVGAAAYETYFVRS